jgi:uncharacterized protein YbjQ (UPF0145 family)
MRLPLLAAVLAASPASAMEQEVAPPSNAQAPEFGVHVYPYDIKDRPYQVLGEVKAGVRKATVFSKSPSQEKIYRELWERAKKLGADAVVNARYGDAHVSALSWGKSNATGTAVKFTGQGTPPFAPQE